MEHAHVADDSPLRLCLHPSADGLDAGHDLAHVHGLAHDVVDPGGEQIERLLERLGIVHGDDRGGRADFDKLWEYMAISTIAKKKCFHRQYIRLGNGLDPVVKVGGAEAGCSDAFAIKPGPVSLHYGFTFVYNNDHWISPESH